MLVTAANKNRPIIEEDDVFLKQIGIHFFVLYKYPHDVSHKIFPILVE